MDENGATRLLAATLMRSESFETFSWVFQQLGRAIPTGIKVALTDGDLTMARAMAQELPTTVHHLCVWHLAKNLSEHLKKLFSQEDWIVVSRMWWAMILESEESYQVDLAKDWRLFLSAVSEKTKPSAREGLEKELAWLGTPDKTDEEQPDSLYAKRRKFAKAFTARHLTCGSAASSRGEGVFAQLRRFKAAGTLIRALAEKLTKFSETAAANSQTKAVCSCIRAAAGEACGERALGAVLIGPVCRVPVQMPAAM